MPASAAIARASVCFRGAVQSPAKKPAKLGFAGLNAYIWSIFGR
jgi:hypothetical protein